MEPSPVTSAPVAKAEPARVRELSKDEVFGGQIKNLYDSLEKEDIGQSVTILDAMGDTMNLAAVDILEILLEYVDEPVRVHAAFALGKLGQKSSLEPLIRALDDPSVQVRENAAIALGKIGDQRAVAPLQQVSTEDVRAKESRRQRAGTHRPEAGHIQQAGRRHRLDIHSSGFRRNWSQNEELIGAGTHGITLFHHN